jgi:hypothetical protein
MEWLLTGIAGLVRTIQGGFAQKRPRHDERACEHRFVVVL